MNKENDQIAIPNEPVSYISINRAALKGFSVTYSYSEIRSNGYRNDLTNKCSAIAHKDLMDAFKKLAPHLAVICEEVEAKKIKDITNIPAYDEAQHKDGGLEHQISKFSVDAIKVSSDAVTISGQKLLSTGDFVDLVAPKIEYEASEYEFVDELHVAVDDLVHEVHLYHDGKIGVKQGDLFDDAEKDSDTYDDSNDEVHE